MPVRNAALQDCRVRVRKHDTKAKAWNECLRGLTHTSENGDLHPESMANEDMEGGGITVAIVKIIACPYQYMYKAMLEDRGGLSSSGF